MNILVTAGNTLTPIDQVRAITNVFTGVTGARIALHAQERGHTITLLTSASPDLLGRTPAERWHVKSYRTFDDLHGIMETEIRGGRFDAIIHCAAVSDYRTDGVYSPRPGTQFDQKTQRWAADSGTTPTMIDRAAGKVKSDEPELWLRLVRTQKLVDLIRTEWGFRGILVKFKLEVGVRDERLLEIAEKSRVQSAADLMVANTWEGRHDWAFLGPLDGRYEKIDRAAMPARLLDAVEALGRSERMANVLLGVTGSVAAIRTPILYQELKHAGHRVRVVSTKSAVYFFDPAALDGVNGERNRNALILDDDEWPGQKYQRGDAVLHIELRRWADLFLIAPLDANTLAKLANGLSDNCLTCVWRAWDPARPVVLAPAMNTLMWQHPLTRRHLRQLATDSSGKSPPAELDQDGLVTWINDSCPKLHIVPPQEKELACGDVGIGAMAEVSEIVKAVDSGK